MPTLTGRSNKEEDKKDTINIEKHNTVSSSYFLPEGLISDEVLNVMVKHGYGRNILSIIKNTILKDIRTPTDTFFGDIVEELSEAYGDEKEIKIRKHGNVKRYLPPNEPLSKTRIESMYYRPLKMWAKKNPYIRSEIERAKRFMDYKIKGKVHKSQLDYLSWIASSFRALVNNDFDAWIGVVGYEGTGKSAFALGLARYLGYYGFKFNPLTNIFFASTPVDYIIEMMENTEEQVFIFDEASAFFDNRNSQKAEQKRLIQTMIMNRARRHVVILCTPDIKGIDIKLRERRVTMIFQLLDRNHFAVLLKHTIGQTEDGFMYKVINKSILSKQDQSVYSLINTFLNLPTCYGVFRTSGMLVSRATYNFYKKMKMELNKVSTGNVSSTASPTMVLYDILAYILNKKKEVISEYSRYVGMDPTILESMMKTIIPKKVLLNSNTAQKIYEELMEKTHSKPNKNMFEDIANGKEVEGVLDSFIENKYAKDEERLKQEELDEEQEEEPEEDVEIKPYELKEIFEDDDFDDEVEEEIEEKDDDEANLPSL